MSTRKDFIRNILMGFAATLLPEILRPVDIGEYGQLPKPSSLQSKRYGDGIYQIRYDMGDGFGYTFWASGKMLNAMNDHHLEMFHRYHCKK